MEYRVRSLSPRKKYFQGILHPDYAQEDGDKNVHLWDLVNIGLGGLEALVVGGKPMVLELGRHTGCLHALSMVMACCKKLGQGDTLWSEGTQYQAWMMQRHVYREVNCLILTHNTDTCMGAGEYDIHFKSIVDDNDGCNDNYDSNGGNFDDNDDKKHTHIISFE